MAEQETQPTQAAQTGQLDNKRLKLQPNIGAFVGLIRGSSIALRRRSKDEKASITGKDYTGQYELPGGAAEPVGDKKTDYWYVLREALRELQEETGITVNKMDGMSAPGLPLFFNAPAGPDLAIVFTLVATNGTEDVEKATATGAVQWFSFDELQTLARENRLVGGYGKRQHIMALYALDTCAEESYIRREARAVLAELGG